MPLYKRTPFSLVEPPVDLNPEGLVFQIRFTKEIFRTYNEYLNRINLYSKRVWACKATGKSNLTYEEALVSEEKASKQLQNIPVEYVTLILHDVQFSMLNLKDLVDSIAAKFQGPFSEGHELYGKKNGRLHMCKIIKIVEDANSIQYEIEWLNNDLKTSGTTLLNDDDLSLKNPPFSKRILKAFIKDSTYRNLPWVLHENLAKKHGIPTSLPEELRSHCSLQNGLIISNRKRRKQTMEPSDGEVKVYKRRHKLNSESLLLVKHADGGNPQDDSIKYPIDDLLLQPNEEDRLLRERPSPCRNFNVPMNCVGDLMMVWDFCASFGRLIKLYHFSISDFENSLCYKDSTPLLIVESYSTLLQLLIKDNADFATVIQNKKRNTKITHVTWMDYLCDFLETTHSNDLIMHISTIKRGHYALLEINVKLAIFCELITRALETEAVRDKLDEFIEERQALSAARRDEALNEGRKRREEKERKKSKTSGKEFEAEHEVISCRSNNGVLNGVPLEKDDKKVSSPQCQSSGLTSEIEQGNTTSKKNAKKRKLETNTVSEDINNPSKRDIHKLMKNEVKETIGMKSAEERKGFLEREIEKRYIRTCPLGKDRDYQRYWFFRRDGRVFVEDSESTQWGYYETKEELDALIGSMNPKGVRERALKKQLEKFCDRICTELQKRSKVVTRRMEVEEALVRRSTRVRAPLGGNPSLSFLKYANKWKV